MGLLDNNKVRLLSVSNIVTDSSVSVNTGSLKVYSGLSSQFAVLSVNLSDSSKAINAYVMGKGAGAGYFRFPIYTQNGDILPAITKSGIYYIDLSGITENVYVYSTTTVAGLTVDLKFQQLTERPASMSLKNIQTIVSGVETLNASETEKRIHLYSEYIKEMLGFFKFLAVNAVYKDSANANVYKTTFKLSKFDLMENGYNMWVQDIVTVANRYAIQSEWIPLQTKAMTLIFTFNAASAGDKLYYEVKGIR